MGAHAQSRLWLPEAHDAEPASHDSPVHLWEHQVSHQGPQNPVGWTKNMLLPLAPLTGHTLQHHHDRAPQDRMSAPHGMCGHHAHRGPLTAMRSLAQGYHWQGRPLEPHDSTREAVKRVTAPGKIRGAAASP